MNLKNHFAVRTIGLGCLVLVLALSLPAVRAEAASYVVNTTDDVNDGACDAVHCSLREAINAANANPGPDEISFDIPGPAPHLIVLRTTLPPLTDDGTTIDGTTEPGYAGHPVVAIRPCGQAVLVGCAASALGLPIQSSNNVIRGLSWFGFGIYNPSGPWQPDAGSPRAIDITGGAANRIEANYIGLDPAGTAVGNSAGLRLRSPGQIVTGNVISGSQIAIHILAPDQVIQGNRIGTDPGGMAADPNGWGIYLDNGSGSNLIGGAGASEGNLISGNDNAGLFVAHEAPGNEVYGNTVGTNAAGNAAVPNFNGLYIVGHDNHLGGPGPGEGNLISGNTAAGILISSSSEGNWIQGNRIGSDSSGAAAIPNGSGIESEGSYSTIGSQWPGEGNLILGNLADGINLNDLARHNWVVGNTIRSNGGAGIRTSQGPDVYWNNFSLNSIFENGGLGIELEHDTNEDILPPALTLVTLSSAHGTACPNCTVELFVADPDPSGAGEGKTHLVMVSADPDGNFSANFSGVAACDWITATNTDPEGNTSEFSANRRTCITLPWTWAVLAVAVFAVAGAVMGGTGGRRLRLPRALAVAGGGLVGGVTAMALVGVVAGLRIAAVEGPAFHRPLARPTPTIGSLEDSVELTLDALMTQVMAATLTAHPTSSPTATRTPTPVVTPTLTPSPTPAELPATLIQNANCRSGPGTEGYRIVTSFAAGEVVTLMGRNPEETWSLVRRDYADGSILCWIWDGALQGDTSDLPVLEPPPTMTPTPTPPVGCWVPGTAGNVCTYPCPAGASGGPCTLP